MPPEVIASLDPLVGRFFHSKKSGQIEWQGKVLALLTQDTYIVQLYSWADGGATTQRLVRLEQMAGWDFYSDEIAWRDEGETSQRRTVEAQNARQPRREPPDSALRAALAAYAHEAWAGWMKYLFQHTVREEAEKGQVIPKSLVNFWVRQMNTPYAELPGAEQENHRKEADAMLRIMDDWLQRQMSNQKEGIA